MQSTSGPSQASDSTARRTAQKISSPGTAAEESPIATSSRSRTVAASGPVSGSASTPPAARTISPSAQNVIPRPYGMQRPLSTVAPSPRLATNSLASLDLPIPGGPRTRTGMQQRRSSARPRAACRCWSCRWRPTSGPSFRRPNSLGSGSTASPATPGVAPTSLSPGAAASARAPPRLRRAGP